MECGFSLPTYPVCGISRDEIRQVIVRRATLLLRDDIPSTPAHGGPVRGALFRIAYAGRRLRAPRALAPPAEALQEGEERT